MKSPDHPDYRSGPFTLLSKWSRENIPKPPPRFRVGDVVRLTVITEITKVYEDCDGTPLYATTNVGCGWSDDCLEPATDSEMENY